MTDFEKRVYETVRRIPSGHVATYGQIAAAIGRSRAARAVGNALHKNPDGDLTPCFRVVNASGHLSKAYGFGGVYAQRKRLEEDGVMAYNFTVDLMIYQCRDSVLRTD